MVKLTVSEAVNIQSIGYYQTAVMGDVGYFVTATPTIGAKELKQIIIDAPDATATASIVISRDTTSTKIFEGYKGNLDADNSIRFADGTTVNDIVFVKVGDEGGGNGEVTVLVRHN